MAIKAVIFDMDGTIIHSHTIWNNIIASLVGEDNREKFFQLRHQAAGRGIEKTCRVLKEEFNFSGSTDYLVELYEQRVRSFFLQNSVAFVEGFGMFHEHLHANNIIMGLATDSPLLVLDILRKKLNLDFLFKRYIYNSCMVSGVFKPNPAVFKYAIQQMGVLPQESVIFEDSLEGVTAAKKLDVFCVGVLRDNNKNELLTADLVIDNYTAITLEYLNLHIETLSRANQFQQKIV